ncbi:efflux RND transporter periplasmic adaptor subunit [Entomohabitans teleogrylli]|uniref:efflux RND transporter periplasmic adaptor subunit n=1 Tax=Entomohabitans teleogrylli TaxID=1384589 RepID=UPI00073D6DDA|nr:efflux RND transporter periplasmic adaptor subunit [Entomohabitans teleogrylli]
MKNSSLALAAVAIAVISTSGGYFLGAATGGKHADSGPAPREARAVLYWYDPMVPGQRFDKPGKSPFMDMELVPRYADEQSADGVVTISPRQQQNLGIRTAAVERRVLSASFRAVATVTPDERRVQRISATASGIVEKLYVNAPQQQVRAGEPLALLWIPEWTAAQQEYLAVRRLGDSQLSAAARARLELLFMPAAVISEVERSGKPQTRITLRAPQSGYISQLDIRAGAQVTAGAPLFELASLDPLWIVVDYPQSQASALQPGNKVLATTESWPGERFSGQISEILPVMDSATRTLKARVEINNPGNKLRPGMYLNITRAAAENGPAVLAIPEEALIATGSHNRVLLADSEGHFAPQEVVTGAMADSWVEIISGLKPGQRVVASGQFLIDSEASLRSALNGETPAAPALTEYQTTGIVKTISPQAITITHQPVPELKWGVMTMDFTPGAQLDLQDIAPGSRVMFRFTMDEQGIVITHLMPLAEEQP